MEWWCVYAAAGDLEIRHTGVDADPVLPQLFTGRGRVVRKWREQTSFSEGPLSHELVVEPGPGGRPGERLRAPSRSLYAPRLVLDNSSEDFRVLVDRHGSTFAAVCLRRITSPQEVEESTWRTLTRFLRRGCYDNEKLLEGPYEITEERIAGEIAYHHSIVLNRSVLSDWRLAHDGWLFAIGTLLWAPSREHDTTLARTREILATWEWLPSD